MTHGNCIFRQRNSPTHRVGSGRSWSRCDSWGRVSTSTAASARGRRRLAEAGGHRRERDGDHRARARPAESSAKGAEKTREGRRGGDRIESQRGLEGDAADGRVERGAIGVAAPRAARVALSKRDGARVVVAAGVRTRAVSARVRAPGRARRGRIAGPRRPRARGPSRASGRTDGTSRGGDARRPCFWWRTRRMRTRTRR